MRRLVAGLAFVVLLIAAAPAHAQRFSNRFEATEGAVMLIHPAPVPGSDANAGGSALGSVMGGIALGTLTGAIAAIPITTYEVVNCYDCWFVGLAVPVFAAGGALLGGVGGAVAHDSETAGRRAARNADRHDNIRSRAADTGAGATIGMLVGLAATVGVSYAMADRWRTDPETGQQSRANEALLLGFVAPVSTIAGALLGARVDARGGDVIDAFDEP